MPRTDIGEILKAKRVRLGFSQEYAAMRAGITAAQLSRIESGKSRPSWHTIVQVLNVLAFSREEKLAMLETLENASSAPEVDLSLYENIRTFSHAAQLAKRAMEEGDFQAARVYIAVMQARAEANRQMADAKAYLACFAKDLGMYGWALDLFGEALSLLGPESDEELSYEIFINAADIFISQKVPALAEALCEYVYARTCDEESKWRYSAEIQLGRVAFLKGNLIGAVELLRHGLDGYERLENERENMSSWFRVFLAEALAAQEETRSQGLAMFERLIKRWRPEANNAGDPEIFAWAAAKYAMLTTDNDLLRQARVVAQQHRLQEVINMIDDYASDAGRKAPVVGRLAARAFFYLITVTLLLVSFTSNGWAKSVLKDIEEAIGTITVFL
jgi:transcriptional regulator with XRE-family HTH domain